MTIWDAFASMGPFNQWCALWLFWPPLLTILAIARTPMFCWNRWLRHKNITAKGWPPSHLDADGDFARDDS